MPNAAEELLGSCGAASLGTLAWNRTFEGESLPNAAEELLGSCGATALSFPLAGRELTGQMPKRPRTNAERCRGTDGQLRHRFARCHRLEGASCFARSRPERQNLQRMQRSLQRRVEAGMLAEERETEQVLRTCGGPRAALRASGGWRATRLGTTAGSGHDARDSTARRRHDGGQWPRAASSSPHSPWTSFMNHHIQSHSDHLREHRAFIQPS